MTWMSSSIFKAARNSLPAYISTCIYMYISVISNPKNGETQSINLLHLSVNEQAGDQHTVVAAPAPTRRVQIRTAYGLWSSSRMPLGSVLVSLAANDRNSCPTCHQMTIITESQLRGPRTRSRVRTRDCWERSKITDKIISAAISNLLSGFGILQNWSIQVLNPCPQQW